jgi:hypothetical protein
MIRKNKLAGQPVSRTEMKNVRGGIMPCGSGIVRSCNYNYSNADACCNWAFSQGADDFTFNTSTCQCCALYYVDRPCGPEYQIP